MYAEADNLSASTELKFRLQEEQSDINVLRNQFSTVKQANLDLEDQVKHLKMHLEEHKDQLRADAERWRQKARCMLSFLLRRVQSLNAL